MYVRFLLLLVTALLTTASPVMADNREGAFTLSPFAGGQMFPFVGEEHFDGDFYLGIRGGYNFTRNLGAEVVFGKNDTVHDPEASSCTIYQYGADLLYHFRPDKALVPFLAAGFGSFTVDYDDYALSTQTSAYFNIGGGVEYSLTDWFALRADFRYAITLDHGDHYLAGTLGFRFQFGRR